MRKVKFNNRLSIELHRKRGTLPDERIEPRPIEGWLVDDHVCVQKPSREHATEWQVSLYPWGDLVTSGEFSSKNDATSYARDVSALKIDWSRLQERADDDDPAYRLAVSKLGEVRDRYLADGMFRPSEE